MKALALLLLMLPVPAFGQVLNAALGVSNYSGDGVGLTLYEPWNTYYAGIGIFNNRLFFGASDTFKYDGFLTRIGTSQAGLGFDGGSISLAVTGLMLRKEGTDSSITILAGLSGNSFQTSFVNTARPSNVALGGLYKRKIHGLTFSGLGVVNGGLYTATTGTSYQSEHAYLMLAGGLLTGRKFLDGGAGYRFSKLGLRVQHQDYFQPFHLTSDSFSADIRVEHFGVGGSVNQGSSPAGELWGESLGVNINYAKFTESSSWYKSGRESFIFHLLTERTGHLILTENVTQTQHGNTFGVGGGWSGNRVSFNLSNNIQFLPTKGFTRVTAVTVSIRIHDTVLRANNITNSYGKTLWSADSSTYHPVGSQDIGGYVSQIKTGNFVVEGDCQQPDGSIVQGCVLEISQGRNTSTVISGSDGHFQARFSKSKSATVKLVDYVGAGDIEQVSAPSGVMPGEKFVLVVRRKQQ